MRTLELKVPPPAVALLTAGIMWLVSRYAPVLAFTFPVRNALASTLAAVGFATALSGFVTFRRAKTTINPTTPQASSSLVTWGVYAFTRNPMYLGLLLVLTAWGFFLANALAFLFLPAFALYINRFQIVPEERALASLFGAAFAEYKTRVRRWL